VNKTIYQIIEFQDGKFAAKEINTYLWGFIRDEGYLSRNTTNRWDDPSRIEAFCKVKTIDEAKVLIKMRKRLDTTPDYEMNIKHVVDYE
jgi:hypothetical protein